MRPRLPGMEASPSTRFSGALSPSRTSAQSVTVCSVDGTTRPRIASTRLASCNPRSNEPVMSASAVINKFPNECPSSVSSPKRYRKSCVSSVSSSASAVMQLRKSPGGITPRSRRRRPDEPPSSATVTIAVILLLCALSPRSSVARPVPPPIATTRGPRPKRWRCAATEAIDWPTGSSGCKTIRASRSAAYAITAKPAPPKIATRAGHGRNCKLSQPSHAGRPSMRWNSASNVANANAASATPAANIRIHRPPVRATCSQSATRFFQSSKLYFCSINIIVRHLPQSKPLPQRLLYAWPFNRYNGGSSGRGAVRLARTVRDGEVGGSNPLAPTTCTLVSAAETKPITSCRAPLSLSPQHQLASGIQHPRQSADNSAAAGEPN